MHTTIRRFMSPWLAGLVLSVALSGCAGMRPWTRYEVCFGLSYESGKRQVTLEEWQAFVRTRIVAEFPDGFTVFPADGYWRSGTNSLAEPSRILMVVAPSTPEVQKKFEGLMRAYREQFHQECVLEIRTPARVSVY